MIFSNKEIKGLATADTPPHVKLTDAFYLLNVRVAIISVSILVSNAQIHNSNDSMQT